MPNVEKRTVYTCCMCGKTGEGRENFNPYFWICIDGGDEICIEKPQCYGCIKPGQDPSEDGGLIAVSTKF